MTDPAVQPETPKEAKARRTRRQWAALIAGMVAAGLIGLALLVLIGGRFIVLSPAGRDMVVGFVSGKQLGDYGAINVEGLSGDLWSDFTIARVTVTDAEGVWLEATNVRVDWTYWPLITRRFHASEIEAERIRLIRRPLVEASDDAPGGGLPLSIDINRFAANIDLEEGFSQEYGRWTLNGAANIRRFGARSAEVSAFSLTRRGDFLRAEVTWGDRLDQLRVNARAQEAGGGPLAGALGYSPNEPFLASALVNGDGVNARVQTGEFVPLIVRGRFRQGGGTRISGFADFSGSDLLEPFVRRIGRTARFGLATVADPTRQGLEAMAWDLRSDNFASQARGFINTSDGTAPDGVRLSVATPSLSRLTGAGLAGPSAYVGVFRGDAQAWRLDGAVSVRRLSAASYRADRLSGPLNVRVRNGRMALSGDLAVQGGSRAGVIGGLLGPQPRLAFETQRTPDGAFLLQDVDLRGQGLIVEGSGARGMNGSLRFSGRAEITNAGLIRPGARGAFGGPIRASQARPGAPWAITFDGRGRGLTTGMGELDRLLGATPRLNAAGSFRDGRVEIDRAELSGANGRAGARGLVEGDGRLRLALNWNAQGPFGVGPVELDGAMSGDGAITGSLSQPRADLTAAFAEIAAGPLTLTGADMVLSFRRGANASDGRVALTAESNYGPARASGDFFLADGGVRLSGVDVNAGGVAAQGDIALVGGAPASADLAFTARQGAFLASGEADGRVRLTEGGGSDSAILEVTGRNVRFAGSGYLIRTLDLNGRGTLDRLPFTLSADVAGDTPVEFNGSGVYARNGQGQTMTLSGDGRVREIAFNTRNPAVIALSGDGRVVRVDLGVGGGALVGELRQDSNASLIEANLTSVDLGSLSPDLRGRVTGRVSLRGAGDDLSGSANLTMTELRSVDAAEGLAVNGTVDARLAGDTLRLTARAVDEGGVQASAELTLPVETSAAPLRLAVNRTRPMSGEVSLSGQIQPIWDIFLGGEQRLAGQVDGQAAIAGSINDPRITGSLDVRQGSFRDTITGVRLEALTLAARFDGESAQVQTFTANDGSGGTVSGSGRMNLRQGSASSFTLNLSSFRLIDNEIATADASGPITVTRGADGNIQLMGRLNVDEAEIAANPVGGNGIVRMDVIEVNRPGGDPVVIGGDDPEAARRGPSIGLDIVLRSPNGQVWVRGRGLNVEMNVNARVRGTLASPQLTGTARVVRGDYDFAGKRFVFDDSGTVTLSTDIDRIRLDLRAVREDPALTAEVRVTGTAASPEIELTSTPQLPQDEILSQVLFGRSASQLSAFEAAQLASGVASLAGGGGFDVLGNLREFAGLDRLSFGGDASALTVAGGRYLTDNVYFEVIGGGEGGGAVQVEWQVRRNIAVTSRFEGDGDARLAVRWRNQTRQPGTGRQDRRPNRSE
ncbi:MAG: translocation/assembly module TamB domain-containing protein [Brevundimonas sp.]|uniref:translocation/assembly module TamB domain-containing protein n=1 Tax=Brevundimonas sp. TaxID=1871086 RepID=UPI00391D5309